MNNITIIGRLTRDPEYTGSNGDKSQYVKFTVAVDNRFGDNASFFDCIVFGKYADTINRLSKGKLVGVRGRMEMGDPYTDKNGNKRRSWTLRAEEVQFLEKRSDNGTDADRIEQAAKDLLMPDSFEAQEEDMPF